MADFALALFAVGLNAAAQLLLRSGVQGVPGAVTSLGHFITVLPRFLTTPSILAGFACYTVSAGLWLVVLSRLPVSIAYPLQSLGYVMVVVLAHLILSEPLTAHKVVAITLIVLGVLVLARGRA
jgi:multidrug transporter EmrE-like cation transporter